MAGFYNIGVGIANEISRKRRNRFCSRRPGRGRARIAPVRGGRPALKRAQWGAIFWMLCLQYFAGEAIAIAGWRGPYSISENYISDLGAVGCRHRGRGTEPDRRDMLAAACGDEYVICFAGPADRRRHALRLAAISRRRAMGGRAASDGRVGAGRFCRRTGARRHDGVDPLYRRGRKSILRQRRNGAHGHRDARLAAPNTAHGCGNAWRRPHRAFRFRLSGGARLFRTGVGGMERVAAYPFPVWLAAMGALLFRRGGLV